MANSYPISVLLNGNIDLHHLYSQLHANAVGERARARVCMCVFTKPHYANRNTYVCDKI